MAMVPFLASMAAMAVVVSAMVVLSGYAADRARWSAQSRSLEAQSRRLEGVANDNRRILQRSDPCLPGDPPDSERCVRKAASDAALAAALLSIANEAVRQHNEQLAALVEALRERGITASSTRAQPVSPPPTRLSTTRTTRTTPATRIQTATSAPTTTIAPTTTTTCPTRGNSGRCR